MARADLEFVLEDEAAPRDGRELPDPTAPQAQTRPLKALEASDPNQHSHRQSIIAPQTRKNRVTFFAIVFTLFRNNCNLNSFLYITRPLSYKQPLACKCTT